LPEDLETAEEQAFLDRAHRGLDSMRDEASRMLKSVLDLGKGGTFQSRTERDIVVRTSLARLAQLDIGDQALCFGRIDRLSKDRGPTDRGPTDRSPTGPERPSVEGEAGESESFHIGRVAVSAEDLEPLVVDWRAPVAEPFYRATGLDPQGLSRRRHLAVKHRLVTGIEDEYFVPPTDRRGEDRGEVGIGGGGALLSALGEARTGRMGDIVATIQREQDEIIRAPLPGVLMVQGGPGTGKTAVALHRAAYLLYTYRFPLERQGVLVVGPNPLFLRYIEQVLPSLGETGVTLSTVAGLVHEVKVTGVDSLEGARLKGDERMARVLAAAVRSRQRPLRRDAEIPFGPTVLRLTVARSREIVERAKKRSGTHNARRRLVERAVLDSLVEQYRSRTDGRSRTPLASRSTNGHRVHDANYAYDADELANEDAHVDDQSAAELRRRLRRTPEVNDALDRMWPKLAPHELLHDLFGAPPLIALAGKGVLSEQEQSKLFRARSASLGDVAWTTADAALVDEAKMILGPRTTRRSQRRHSTHLDDSSSTHIEGMREEIGYWPSGLDPSPLPLSSRPHNANGYAGHVNAGNDEERRKYGHIVVDEVQDLSPMQLRMLARRSLSGSMTVVGDIAQATGPWTLRSWSDIATHLSADREPTKTELTVSYRTPAEVIRIARRVLAEAAPELTPPRAIRESGESPTFITVERDDLFERVAQIAAHEVDNVRPGRTAVLAPEALLPDLSKAMEKNGTPATDPRDPLGSGLLADLVLLACDEAHGLEFDSVVVVEPELVATGGEPQPSVEGMKALYVALTRPTRRLSVVHSAPLPCYLSATH
jgi:DNA helicase IV